MTPSTEHTGATISRSHYAGLLLLSLGTLLLELTLIRILSVANWYHFGFLVVSTAMLGFSAAGVTLSLWTDLREKKSLDRALASSALLFAVISVLSLWLMQRIPFQPFRLLLDRWQFVYSLFYYVVLAAPFFCSGLAIALLLTRGGPFVNRLYAVDLVGAGLGCAAVCVVMPLFGGIGSLAVSAIFGVLAALAFDSFRSTRVSVAAGIAAVGILGLAFGGERILPIQVIPEKLHPLQPPGRQPIYTKWNAFSKVDVFETPPTPQEGRPDAGLALIVDAGGAGTAIPDLKMGVRKYLASAPEYQPSGLAYIGREHPKVLIIGSGAGREVLEGLYFHASSITAVEINPIINDLVTNTMKERWGGLFEQPEVRLVTEDGRSYVRRSKEKYDAIISIQTMSDAAFTSGALSLSETYVLTREAFEDYWSHLTPNGTLLITRPSYQIPRLFATTRELFDRNGLGSAADHVVAFRGVVAPFGHRQFLTGFLLQKSPLQLSQVAAIKQRLGVGQNAHWGDTGQPEIYYSPFEAPQNPFQAQLADLVKSSHIMAMYRNSPDKLSPATDDKPFFNERLRWTRLRLSTLRAVLSQRPGVDIGIQPIAEATLVVLLIQTVVLAGVMILFPLLLFDKQGLRTNGRWNFLGYFASLGLGFILIEIILIQRFSLFLGQPIYTFAVVLGALLIYTGVGSFLANLIQNVSRRTISFCLLGVIGTVLFSMVVIPEALTVGLGLSFPLRVALTLLLIAPVGIVLGVPFPTGLRLVAKEAPPLVAWAWAVNGFFTVIGSVAAMILGMAVGFTVVLVLAAACYAVAWIAISTGRESRGVKRMGVGSETGINFGNLSRVAGS